MTNLPNIYSSIALHKTPFNFMTLCKGVIIHRGMAFLLTIGNPALYSISNQSCLGEEAHSRGTWMIQRLVPTLFSSVVPFQH